MLFRLADRLRAHVDGKEPLPWDLEMACIEAFALHARVLIEFLWHDPQPNARFPDDAFAADYFQAGEWAKLRALVQDSQLAGVKVRTGREVAHLSYARTESEASDWPFDSLAGVFGRAFRLFLENVPKGVVSSDFEVRIRSVWPEYLNYPAAVSFPPDSNARSVATTGLTRLTDVIPATTEDLLP